MTEVQIKSPLYIFCAGLTRVLSFLLAKTICIFPDSITYMEKDTFMTVLYTVLVTLSIVSVTAFVFDVTGDEIHNENVVNFEIPDNPNHPPEYPPSHPEPFEPNSPIQPDYPTPIYYTS